MGLLVVVGYAGRGFTERLARTTKTATPVEAALRPGSRGHQTSHVRNYFFVPFLPDSVPLFADAFVSFGTGL